MCECSTQCIDIKTPRNVFLSACYKRSFAYHTVKNRMPTILTQIIDGLTRSKDEIYENFGENGQEDLKYVIGELSKFKYEVQTNKPLTHLNSDAPDIKYYNDYIASQSASAGDVSHFSAIWLLTECYMYRRVKEAFEMTSLLTSYDPFMKQKRESYFHALPLMETLAHYLQMQLNDSSEATQQEFIHLLKINLWGNKCDLSLTNGKMISNFEELFNLEVLDKNILCDQSNEIWTVVSEATLPIIDIIFDNSGYELFTDLCIADFLISKRLASTVRLYVKTIPWFISDVMRDDFFWTLDQLAKNENEYLKTLASRWSDYITSKTWIVVENDFWTLPFDFSMMRDVNPALYRKLGKASLAIFKGDLNYRKLFGEKNWDPTTPVEEALQNFHPTKLCSLRTIKADIVCGLQPGVSEAVEKICEKWMETGDYGLIQFCGKIVPL